MNRENMMKLKNELKENAIKCRNLKAEVKEKQREDYYRIYSRLQFDLLSFRKDIRYKHIAYCIARGTEYFKIEPKVREGNEIRMTTVERYIASYGLTEEEEEVAV